MFYVSKPMTTPPSEFKTPLQKLVYETLAKLDIPFERVDSDPAITMEACLNIDAALNMHTVKTLLVCNRQQTEFYQFVTTGDKPFVTKNFGAALEISRVSFATAEHLENMMGTIIGSSTIFSMLLETAKNVHLVIDKDVLKDEYYGFSDGTTTGYAKIKTKDLLEKFIPYTGHTYKVIEV